jgi:two-component system, NtrC family, response regulator AtoC
MPAETTSAGLIDKLNEPWFVWGESTAIQPSNKLMLELAATHIPFLLIGESGTGKDVYARAIHLQGCERPGALKKIVCAAITPQHLVQELQGNVEGASTGKTCTIYLDEVEMLSADCQRQLLTYLSDSMSNDGTPRPRLISSTTCDLQSEVEEGRFRRELYFRVNGACLQLPPLRERHEDIIVLARHFLNWHAEELKKRPPALSQETKELLMAYHWPGNIRELENATRKMVALGNSTLALSDLRVARMARPARGTQGELSPLKKAARAASRQTERELILRALQRTKWNRKRAAQELQISYKSLLYKLKQIETPGTKNDE